jgi:hypothetical protein
MAAGATRRRAAEPVTGPCTKWIIDIKCGHRLIQLCAAPAQTIVPVKLSGDWRRVLLYRVLVVSMGGISIGGPE